MQTKAETLNYSNIYFYSIPEETIIWQIYNGWIFLENQQYVGD